MNKLMIPVTYKLDIDSCSNKINKKNIKKTYANYYILQYNKTYICFDDTENGMYRSVVFSDPEKKILSFSPIKSIPSYVFIDRYPVINDEIVIKEHIEGVMINLFYDNRISRWKIATKGAIGGNYGFAKPTDKNETFYDMFLESLSANKDETLNEIEIIKILPIKFSYTFILQHPNNVINKPVKIPHCYLIAVYSINSNENEVEYIPCTVYENWSIFNDINGVIEFPKQYYTDKYESIIKTDYGINFVITNISTGEHCKVTSFYKELFKKIIHIDSSIQYQYFCMRRIGKIKEYIKMFPKHKKAFFDIQDDYQYFVSTIYELYCNCYIYKSTNINDIEPKYFTHIYKIHHSIYIASISNKKINKKPQKIYRKTVLKYFDNIDPRELLFILSSDKRDL